MAFDGLTLNIIKNQLQSAIGSRIEKVNMPNKYSILLNLSSKDFSGRLLLCCNPSSPRVHLTKEKYENPQTPPMLCMLLRKRFTGGRLVNVRQQGVDRVLYLDFQCRNELGDEVNQTIIIEILGRLSNIIFTCENKIIDCVRRFDPEEGKRFLISGASYQPPESQNKINILTSDADCVIEKLKSLGDIPVDKALCSILDGASPIICREICYRAMRSFPNLGDISETEFEKLKINLTKLTNYLENPEPTIIKDKRGKLIDCTFMQVHQYGIGYENIIFESVDLMFDKYYTMRDNAENIRKNASDLLKLITNLSERTKRKIEYRKKDLKSTEKRDKYRVYGELIKTNLHLLNSGDKSLTTINYYDENCAEITIPLDEKLSPAQNAQKYFKNYKKASVAAGMLSELIEQAQSELKYFDSVFDCLSRAQTNDELDAIRRELIETGYVRAQKNIKLKPRQIPYMEFEIDGFKVCAGKNNVQNDTLTLKVADKFDIWLHTKDIAGSHVVIFADRKEVPDDVIKKAANIAAVNSKGADSSGVPVEYCYAKFVKKPSGAKPGMVIYTNNKTLYVTPDKTTADNFRIK